MPRDLGNDLGIQGGGKVGLEKLGDEGLEPFARHSPQVAEKEPLHRAQAEDPQHRERDTGQEEEQPDATPPLAPQDEIAEERLRVVREKGVVEVEKGEAPVHRRPS